MLDPIRPLDAESHRLALALLQGARHGALAVTDADGSPGISRIALGLDPQGAPMTLISALASHSAALRANPLCAVMLGEVAGKGDPLTHPRLMIKARAEFIAPEDPDRPTLRDHWLRHHPKAKLYIDFSDFAFVRLLPQSALLNAGFGRANRLAPADLRP